MTTSQSKRCVFCGKPGASDEHVFAEWLTDVLPGDGVFTTGGSGRRRTKNSKGMSIISRAPCIPCNTGWMSELEDRAKPLLAPAIRGEPVTWTTDARDVLGAWSVKTALMADRTSVDVVVPDEHFRHLYDTGSPEPSTRVWVASMTFPPGRSFFEAVNVLPERLTLESSNHNLVGYRILFSVGYLVVRVFGVVDGRELSVTPAFGIPELWPGDGEAFDWPPPQVFSAAELRQLLG